MGGEKLLSVKIIRSTCRRRNTVLYLSIKGNNVLNELSVSIITYFKGHNDEDNNKFEKPT